MGSNQVTSDLEQNCSPIELEEASAGEQTTWALFNID
jgi:hypothetical protein